MKTTKLLLAATLVALLTTAQPALAMCNMYGHAAERQTGIFAMLMESIRTVLFEGGEASSCVRD
jgi:hypothetical protein